MDKKTIELIAIGASAAVNCRPCMEYHLKQANELAISSAQIRAALEVGMRVNQGAAKKTANFVAGLLGEEGATAQDPAKGRCCA